LTDFGQIDGATHATLLGAGYKDTDPSQPPSPLDFICADRKVLLDVLPKPNELPLLCHVQRLLLEPDETADDAANDAIWTQDPHCDVAVVIGNRLPLAKRKYHACLVSLENRADLYQAGPDRAYLVVLYHWSFTAGPNADFEELITRMRCSPNGGVLSFGQTPLAKGRREIGALTEDGTFTLDADLGRKPATGSAQTRYHGPLLPSTHEPPKRSPAFALRPEVAEARPGEVPDVSLAAAFAVGRMLACSDEGLLQDLQNVVKKWSFPPLYYATGPLPSFLTALWAPDPPLDFSVWDTAPVQLAASVQDLAVVSLVEQARGVASEAGISVSGTTGISVPGTTTTSVPGTTVISVPGTVEFNAPREVIAFKASAIAARYG
jgi:hypothetical protein